MNYFPVFMKLLFAYTIRSDFLPWWLYRGYLNPWEERGGWGARVVVGESRITGTCAETEAGAAAATILSTRGEGRLLQTSSIWHGRGVRGGGAFNQLSSAPVPPALIPPDRSASLVSTAQILMYRRLRRFRTVKPEEETWEKCFREAAAEVSKWSYDDGRAGPWQRMKEHVPVYKQRHNNYKLVV